MQALNVKHQNIPNSYILKTGCEFFFKKLRGTGRFDSQKFQFLFLKTELQSFSKYNIMIDVK